MCEGERIVESFHLRQVQVSVVNVMVDSYEDLSLTCIHYCILLHAQAHDNIMKP